MWPFSEVSAVQLRHLSLFVFADKKKLRNNCYSESGVTHISFFFSRERFRWGDSANMLFTQILQLFDAQLQHPSLNINILSHHFSCTLGLEAWGPRCGCTLQRTGESRQTEPWGAWESNQHQQLSTVQTPFAPRTGDGHRDTTHKTATSRKN